MMTMMWFEEDNEDYIGFVVEHDDKDEYGENDEAGGRDLAWQPPLYCPLHLRHLDGDDNDLLISPVKMCIVHGGDGGDINL